MARNRKRAKERRARRPQPVATGRDGRDEAPDPIAHATPDVELAEAQLAVGRAELDEDEDERGFAEDLVAEEPDEFEEPEPEVSGAGGGGDRVRIGAGFDGDVGGPGGGLPTAGGAAAVPAGAAAARRVEPQGTVLARLMGFLQGSWRELQRVQWPDRRQVAQATAVVIGFVVVAAVFLGLADLASSHLVKFLLK